MKKKRPEGWEGVVWDCERLLECPDHAESPSMSNLANLVRDRIVRSQEDQDKKLVSQNPEKEMNSPYTDGFVNFWVPTIRKFRESVQWAGIQMLPSMNECLEIIARAIGTAPKEALYSRREDTEYDRL